MEVPPAKQSNFETFRDCLSVQLVSKLAPRNDDKKKRARNRKKSLHVNDMVSVGTNVEGQDANSEETDAEELAEFVDYLAIEIFTSLPEELRTLSYSAIQSDSTLALKYSDPLSSETLTKLIDLLPPSITDSLIAYSLISSTSDLSTFLTPVFTSHIQSTISPPPIWQSTRASSCELCSRSWIPLTYHHLIPKAVHSKAIKRGWAEEWELNKVAWLCRACHSFVHRVATNEELAKEWHSVEKLMEREDVRGFVGWVGRVRWKAK